MKVQLLRYCIAIGVGILITLISIYVGWKGSGNSRVAWPERMRTEEFLMVIDHAIIIYQQKSNAAPVSLEQIMAMKNDEVVKLLQYEMEYNGGFNDGWKRPFLVSMEGTNLLVTSLGRDGKPGGKGVDFDLTNKNRFAKDSMPTFRQFLANERCHGLIVTCCICGILAALLSCFTVRIPDLTARGLTILSLRLIATLVGTLLVTLIITVLHIPNGH